MGTAHISAMLKLLVRLLHILCGLTFAWAPADPSVARQVSGNAPSTREALDRLDAHARGVADAGQFSGVVLVAKDGVVVFERAYGLRDEKGDGALTTDTRFDLASAGKMFAATAVLQQIAAGRLALDTKLGAVLPDYPNAAMREATVL